MKYPHLAIGIALIALVGAACAAGANTTPSPVSTATAAPTATLTPTATPTAPPTAAPTATLTPTATPTATSPRGQMTHGRSYQAATALDDGRVLLAGGFFDAAPMTWADLYDPSANAFSATSAMGTARGFETATLLLDGRVLFAGGNQHTWTFNGPFIASAELYDPHTGTFSPTGSLGTARNLHTATLLLDGRVLITGGNDTFDHALNSAELFDPRTGTFSPTDPMATPRGFHNATRLLDGRVLITGGGSTGWAPGHFVASAEIYDPTDGTFSATGPMTTERALHSATLLDDGRVLITGGFNNVNNGSTSLDSAELYDPQTGKFKATGSMADSRTFHGATLLADGRLLVTGGVHTGWDYVAPFLASAEIYDPTTGMFSPTGSMTDRRISHTATILPGGRVLIAGGFNGTADVATAELYDSASGTFSPTGSGS